MGNAGIRADQESVTWDGEGEKFLLLLHLSAPTETPILYSRQDFLPFFFFLI